MGLERVLLGEFGQWHAINFTIYSCFRLAVRDITKFRGLLVTLEQETALYLLPSAGGGVPSVKIFGPAPSGALLSCALDKAATWDCVS